MATFFKQRKSANVGKGGGEAGSGAAGNKTADDVGDFWNKIKEEKTPAVVSIEMNYPWSFGFTFAGGGAGIGAATGFVVDKDNGIILTNRHVVTDGPIRAKAVFIENEEVDLVPIYRDPIHDFGFFKFDTSKLVYTPRREIKLSPEKVKTGQRILLIGNSAGEKISYVETIMSRTDRDAPLLDFNTFYYNTIDMTVQGSSGGPVLNTEGEAVAMNAAGNNMMNTSFKIPVDRAKRALNFLRKGEDVPRGTLQTAFVHKTFEEVARLGVGEKLIGITRKEHEASTGMLVVERLLAAGTGYFAGMRVGDVLVSINGVRVHNFSQLADFMDDNVGKTLDFEFVRGGEFVAMPNVEVEDLALLAPNEGIRISDGMTHELPIQAAMFGNLERNGIYVSQTGYMFTNGGIPEGSIILSIGAKPTPNLDAWEEALKELPHGKRVAVRFYHIMDKNVEHVKVITIDKRWFPFLRTKRDDKLGIWVHTPIHSTITDDEMQARLEPGSGSLKLHPKPPEFAPANALVRIAFYQPFDIDGVRSKQMGANGGITVGLVVDKTWGLVVCDRLSAHTTLGDVTLTFGASVAVNASVLFTHPFYNFSILKFDPMIVEQDPTAELAELRPSDKPVQVGDKQVYYGLNHYQSIIRAISTVTLSEGFYARSTRPSFVPRNHDILELANVSGLGGFVADESDPTLVTAFVTDFFKSGSLKGIPVSLFKEHVENVRNALETGSSLPTFIRALPLHLSPMPIVDARSARNLSDEWAIKLMRSMNNWQRTVLTCDRTMVGTEASYRFVDKDVILAVNDTPVALTADFAELTNNQESVDVTVLRNLEVKTLTGIETTLLPVIGTQRIVIFAGMVLQPCSMEVKFLGFLPDNISDGGIFIGSITRGSPANQSKSCQDLSFITMVENTEVSNLDEFIEVVRTKKHDEYVRFTSVDILTGEFNLFTLRLDLEFFETRELVRNQFGEWNNEIIEHEN